MKLLKDKLRAEFEKEASHVSPDTQFLAWAWYREGAYSDTAKVHYRQEMLKELREWLAGGQFDELISPLENRFYADLPDGK